MRCRGLGVTRMVWRLRTQIALLVLGMLLLAQALSLWFFVDERSLAVQAAIGAEAAGRAANIAQLVEGAPANLHSQIIRAATSPTRASESGIRASKTCL